MSNAGIRRIRSRGKWVQIGNWMDAEAAKGLIGEAIERARS